MSGLNLRSDETQRPQRSVAPRSHLSIGGHGITHLALATESPPQIGALSPGELRARTDWLADGTYVVFVAGEVALSTSAALVTSLAAPTLDRARSIVVDLTTCTFMDASGLFALVGANERLCASGGRLALVVRGTCLLRALEVTGLRDVFAIHASRTAALAPPAETWVDEARRRVSIRSANERLEWSCIGLGSIDHERFFFICECGDRACGGPAPAQRRRVRGGPRACGPLRDLAESRESRSRPGPPSRSEPETVRGRLVVLVHRRAVALARARRRSNLSTDTGAIPQHASRLLARLPAAEREAVALAYFGGLTLSEAAQVTGTTRETVGRLVSSAPGA